MKSAAVTLDAVPLLPYLLTFAAGILLSPVVGSVNVWCAMIVTVIALFVARKPIVATWMASLLLGNIDGVITTPTAAEIRSVISSREIAGYITDITENDYCRILTVDVAYPHCSPAPVNVRLVLTDFDRYIPDGSDITVHCRLASHPQLHDLPFETDFSARDRRHGIIATGYITSDSIVSLQPSGTLRSYIAHKRSRIKDFILCSSFSSELKEFLVAVLLGDSSLLRDSARQAFAQVGLSHILAMSGLHVAIISLLLTLALWPMQRIGLGWWRPLPIMIILWAYAFITGLSPSVTRAVIMASVYIIGRLTERRASPYNSLCFAALLILLFSPSDIYDVGFQLSFAAVLAILLFANDFNPVSKRRRLLYNTVSYVTVSLAAVIGTFAVSAFYFHIIPLNFLPANFLAALLFPVLFASAIITLLLHAVGLDIPFFYTLVDALYSVLCGIADFFTGIGPHVIRNVYISGWSLIPLGCAIAALKMWIVRRRMIWSGVMLACILLFILVDDVTAHPIPAPRVYAGRHAQRTDMVIDAGDGVLRIVSTAPQQPLAVAHDCRSRYRDFMGHLGIDSLLVVTADSVSCPGFSVRNSLIRFPRFSIALICGPVEHHVNVDYAVLCAGARGSLTDILQHCHADTVILSYDLRQSIAERWAGECAALDIPCISLRQRSWSRAL